MSEWACAGAGAGAVYWALRRTDCVPPAEAGAAREIATPPSPDFELCPPSESTHQLRSQSKPKHNSQLTKELNDAGPAPLASPPLLPLCTASEGKCDVKHFDATTDVMYRGAWGRWCSGRRRFIARSRTLCTQTCRRTLVRLRTRNRKKRRSRGAGAGREGGGTFRFFFLFGAIASVTLKTTAARSVGQETLYRIGDVENSKKRSCLVHCGAMAGSFRLDDSFVINRESSVATVHDSCPHIGS